MLHERVRGNDDVSTRNPPPSCRHGFDRSLSPPNRECSRPQVDCERTLSSFLAAGFRSSPVDGSSCWNDCHFLAGLGAQSGSRSPWSGRSPPPWPTGPTAAGIRIGSCSLALSGRSTRIHDPNSRMSTNHGGSIRGARQRVSREFHVGLRSRGRALDRRGDRAQGIWVNGSRVSARAGRRSPAVVLTHTHADHVDSATFNELARRGVTAPLPRSSIARPWPRTTDSRSSKQRADPCL